MNLARKRPGGEFLRRAYRRLLNSDFVRWIHSERYLLLHAIEARQVEQAVHDEFNVNSVTDLACFRQTERWLDAGTFAAEARRRTEKERMQVYTVAADGVLLHYGWLVPSQQRSWFPYVQQHYDYPPGTAVLFNAWTHPAARGTGLHTRSMKRRIADGAAQPGARWIYTAIESHNRASRKVAARCGMKCVDVLYERISFGRRERGRLSPATYFSSVERNV